METAKRKIMYTSRYAYATHTDWIRTHGNGPLQVSIRPVGLVQVGYTCRFDLVLIFVSCKKRHLLFTNSFFESEMQKQCSL